jgi:hypothetical protein
MFIQALNRNLNLQRFHMLYVSGNYSAILSRLNHRFEALEIRRANSLPAQKNKPTHKYSTRIFSYYDKK